MTVIAFARSIFISHPMLRRFLLRAYVAVAFVLAVFPQISSAGQRVDTVITASDGAVLSLLYVRPGTPPPAGGYPALVLVHGFGGSNNDYAVIAHRYADSGYFCVAYTVRGQGQGNQTTASGGLFNWFTADRELDDCREVIEWTRSRPYVNGSRVGMEGMSQGGLTAWGAAIERMNIRCAVPVIGVPLYAEAMAPNGTENYFVVTALALANTFQLVKYNRWCLDTLMRGLEQDRYADVRREFEKRDLGGQVSRVQVPVFMQMAWQDDIFNAHQFFQAFHGLEVPKKLYVWPGPHALPGGALEELRMAMTFRFYRRWLCEDEGETIMHADSAVALVDPGDGAVHWYHADARARYDPSENSSLTGMRMYFDRGGRISPLPPASPVAHTMLYVQNISNDAHVFRSPSLRSPWGILGGRASLVVNSTGRKYQANVMLWDYDSVANRRRPITRGSYQVRLESGEPADRRRIEYEVSPQLYWLAEGHQLEVWVKYGIPGLPLQKPADEFGQTPYAPQETVIDTLFSSPGEPSYVDLYLWSAPPSSVAREPVPTRSAMILPNPVRGGEVAYLRRGKAGAATLEILDARGVCIRSLQVEGHDLAIPTSGLPAGAYCAQVRDATAIVSARFVVLH